MGRKKIICGRYGEVRLSSIQPKYIWLLVEETGTEEESVRPGTSWREVPLTPHRARELGKALIRMAGETEQQ